MKKVLFISGRLGGGGSERVLTLIANQMLRWGYEVSILAFGDASEPYENNCPTTILKCVNKFNQICKIRKETCKISPDVVIAFEYHVGMKTVLATLGLSVKVIVSERNDPQRLDSRPVKKLMRNYLYGLADLLVFQTDDAKKYFSNRIQKKSLVLCNPIKLNLPNWNYSNAQKIIINFCRLEKQKNIPLLLRVFYKVHQQHPDYQLRIYGEGSEKEYLKSIVKEMALEEYISFLPFCNNIHSIAAECSMFVSSSNYEGISNSMLEAMAIGMPVICTDCPIGGARMVINNEENGLLVPINDSLAMEKAINMIIDNPKIAKKMADNASQIREKYSLENITNQWCSVL